MQNYRIKDAWVDELEKINLRGYCTGFYFGSPDQVEANFSKEKPPNQTRFAGKIMENTGETGTSVQIRNKLFAGDDVEVFRKNGASASDKVQAIIDRDGNSVPFAQPLSRVTLVLKGQYAQYDLIRRRGTA
jgi:putative protease